MLTASPWTSYFLPRSDHVSDWLVMLRFGLRSLYALLVGIRRTVRSVCSGSERGLNELLSMLELELVLQVTDLTVHSAAIG